MQINVHVQTHAQASVKNQAEYASILGSKLKEREAWQNIMGNVMVPSGLILKRANTHLIRCSEDSLLLIAFGKAGAPRRILGMEILIVAESGLLLFPVFNSAVI